MKVERAIDLHPLVERIVHQGLTVEALPSVGVLAPGKTMQDIKAAMDCSGGAGNFSYEHVVGAVAQRLFNAGVFVETFIEDDD
jgi:hypothetical protein